MIDQVRPFNGFDYIQAGNPTLDVNPNRVGVTWLNITTGEIFICTDLTPDKNVWVGQFGTIVVPAGYNDAFYNDVAFALPLASDYLDYSTNNNTVFVDGAAYLQGGFFLTPPSSSFSDGGTDKIQIASPPDTVNVGTGDFTAEASVFFKTTISAYKDIFVVKYANGLDLVIRTGDSGFGDRLHVTLDSSTINDIYNAPLTASNMLNKWTHIALVRKSGTCTLYVDGAAVTLAQGTGTVYSFPTFASAHNLTVAYNSYFAAGNYVGNIQNVRFTAAARYTDTFTPPVNILLGA